MALFTDGAVDGRRRQLYGPGRQNEPNKIKEVLQQSHVLQNGEYNFKGPEHHDPSWKSTTVSEFRGQRPQVVGKQYETQHTQLATHFRLGNDSGSSLPNNIFQTSTTKADYDKKNVAKPKIYEGDRTINWPDMAPQYQGDRKMGTSEYKNTFADGEVMLNPSRPTYPKLDTSKIKLPVDFEKVRHIKGTNVNLGSDPSNYESETKRAYENLPDDEGNRILQEGIDAAQGVTKFMKDMERSSNVFRAGDYNDIVDNSFQTTFTTDYGRKPNSDTNLISRSDNKKKSVTFLDELEELENNENRQTPSRRPKSEDGRMPSLFEHAINHVAPITFGEARDGKKEHTSAHFKFGNDNEVPESMYAKDYETAGMRQQMKPFIQPPPRDSEVLQRDTDKSFFQSTTTNEFGQHIKQMGAGVHADTMDIARRNLERRHGHNVVFSCDMQKHSQDRQKSTSKQDYVAPPADFKAMAPMTAQPSKYNFLETDGALPFPVPKVKTTDHQFNFIDGFMTSNDSLNRRRNQQDQCKSRLADGKGTHFILGYTQQSHTSEAQENFDGKPKSDENIPPAGKMEKISEFQFGHINHSENTKDMNAKLYKDRDDSDVPIHASSVMMADYTHPERRLFTNAQETMLNQDIKHKNKPIEHSHFFHMDTTGNRNFETTSMADFVKPEMMTGRKFLAAR
ncbi:uncharacterized protein LOC135484199 [Lineus longissimus]|uniref:uncharacterized protein LOC135484199 n=1 Tax=Lineus longissimus TaxID=88925 RepID=UPI002B4E5EA6